VAFDGKSTGFLSGAGEVWFSALPLPVAGSAGAGFSTLAPRRCSSKTGWNRFGERRLTRAYKKQKRAELSIL